MVLKITYGTLLAGLAALVMAANASAGSYHVYTCRTPDGGSAPADGWSGSVAPGGAYDDYTLNTCSTGGALVAALGDATTHLANTDRATWTFEAPSAVRVVGATVWRAGYLHGRSGENATYQSWMAGPSPTNVFDECIFTAGCHVEGDLTQAMSSTNLIAVPSSNAGSHLYVNVSCGAGAPGSECKGGFSDPNNYAAVVYLYAADMKLEQSAGPTAGNVAGELASAASVHGTADVAFTASDPGSGVYEAQVSVDGQLVESPLLNENGGRCRNVGETSDGLPAFLYVQPCLPSLSADIGLDTTRLADGEHHLVVSVIDPAGNSAPVLDREITVANLPASGGPSPSGGSNGGQGAQGGQGAPGASGPAGAQGPVGPPNGTNASAQAILTAGWKGSRGSRLVAPYGHAETIVGRLTAPGGAPIAGAQLGVWATPAFAGAAASATPGPHTHADGTFTLRVPAGMSSRAVRLTYSARLGDPLPAASRTLTLTVRAALRLAIGPRTSSVGGRIFFSGRLLGGPVPAIGKLLVLEARSAGGPWIKFNVIRSDRAGGYHASYRFRFPGPAAYEFRVLSEAEGDYPFAGGASNVVRVQEL
jgi:hypothetical protein